METIESITKRFSELSVSSNILRDIYATINLLLYENNLQQLNYQKLSKYKDRYNWASLKIATICAKAKL